MCWAWQAVAEEGEGEDGAWAPSAEGGLGPGGSFGGSGGGSFGGSGLDGFGGFLHLVPRRPLGSHTASAWSTPGDKTPTSHVR